MEFFLLSGPDFLGVYHGLSEGRAGVTPGVTLGLGVASALLLPGALLLSILQPRPWLSIPARLWEFLQIPRAGLSLQTHTDRAEAL